MVAQVGLAKRLTDRHRHDQPAKPAARKWLTCIAPTTFRGHSEDTRTCNSKLRANNGHRGRCLDFFPHGSRAPGVGGLGSGSGTVPSQPAHQHSTTQSRPPLPAGRESSAVPAADGWKAPGTTAAPATAASSTTPNRSMSMPALSTCGKRFCFPVWTDGWQNCSTLSI